MNGPSTAGGECTAAGAERTAADAEQLPQLVIWESESGSNAVCKVGIGGDFLPALSLQEPDEEAWVRRAQNLEPYFRDLDVAIVNLETPLDSGNFSARVKSGGGSAITSHRDVLSYLKSLSIDVVGVANNHIYDYGEQGVEKTYETLRQEGIVGIGAGRSLQQPPAIHVAKLAGNLRIGFWAASRHGADDVATKSRPGIDVASRARALAAIDQLKAANANLCVALLHGGLEGTSYPEPRDLECFDEFAELGFDVVAGCHSHRISGYSSVKRPNDDSAAFCFHGLGSIATGCCWSAVEREGLLVVVELDSKGQMVRVLVRPIWMRDKGYGVIPDSSQIATIFDRFKTVSAQIANGSYADHFYKDVSQGMLRKHLTDFKIAFANGGQRGIVAKLARLRPHHIGRLWRRLINP